MELGQGVGRPESVMQKSMSAERNRARLEVCIIRVLQHLILSLLRNGLTQLKALRISHSIIFPEIEGTAERLISTLSKGAVTIHRMVSYPLLIKNLGGTQDLLKMIMKSIKPEI